MRIESVVSPGNSSTSLLANGATFTGATENMEGLLSAKVSLIASGSGTLYMEFSQDGSNWDYSESFDVIAATLESHEIPTQGKYYRTRLTNNSGSDYTYLRLQTIIGGAAGGADTSKISSDLSNDSIAQVTKAINYGITDSGRPRAFSSTQEGHQEIAIHSPTLPFGSVHAEKLTPIFQFDAIYGLNTKLVTSTTGRAISGAGSATATAANNMMVCSTGTTSYSFSTIQTRRRLRYRAGQGIVGRFAGLFNQGVASSIQVMGFGTSESGFYFGYNGTSYGILHVKDGVREIQTLTITTASTATNDYEITLPTLPTPTVVNVTATNNGSTLKTAYEIAQGTFPGWSAKAVGSTVVFLAADAGSKGAISFGQTGAGTPAVGSVVETLAGAASTDTWIPQASWNGDTLDGSGDSSNQSGATIDPTKGNVYEIGIQYLGFGSVEFKVEVASENNNPDFIVVHTIRNPNTLTTPHVSQPSFPFTMASYSAGSTTDIVVKAGSCAGFIEGEKKLIGPRMSYYRETNGYVGSTASTFYPLFTIRNSLTYKSRANQSVVSILSLSCAHDDATPISYVLLRNATLGGTPNFAAYSTNSCTVWDTAATTATISSNEQIEFSANLGQSSGGIQPIEDQEITLQPGESITLAARAVTGTATYVIGSMNTREDQ
jgi:hypothetical protein